TTERPGSAGTTTTTTAATSSIPTATTWKPSATSRLSELPAGRRRSRASRLRRAPRCSRSPAYRHPARFELLDVGAADRLRAGFVELVAVQATDVVRLENLRIQHGPRS